MQHNLPKYPRKPDFFPFLFVFFPSFWNNKRTGARTTNPLCKCAWESVCVYPVDSSRSTRPETLCNVCPQGLRYIYPQSLGFSFSFFFFNFCSSSTLSHFSRSYGFGSRRTLGQRVFQECDSRERRNCANKWIKGLKCTENGRKQDTHAAVWVTALLRFIKLRFNERPFTIKIWRCHELLLTVSYKQAHTVIRFSYWSDCRTYDETLSKTHSPGS